MHFYRQIFFLKKKISLQKTTVFLLKKHSNTQSFSPCWYLFSALPLQTPKCLWVLVYPPLFFFSPPFVCFNRASANTAKTCSATAKSITRAKVMSALLCWEAWPSLRRGRTHTLPGQAVTATIVGLLSPAA